METEKRLKDINKSLIDSINNKKMNSQSLSAMEDTLKSMKQIQTTTKKTINDIIKKLNVVLFSTSDSIPTSITSDSIPLQVIKILDQSFVSLAELTTPTQSSSRGGTDNIHENFVAGNIEAALKRVFEQ
mmetsp:Transcript_10398/g.12629  ORF Transcript_10398/g.12629 Transcript_10398/m.12629 type:complete len:129 (+) Transcript_10398:715-1101(+)